MGGRGGRGAGSRERGPRRTWDREPGWGPGGEVGQWPGSAGRAGRAAAHPDPRRPARAFSPRAPPRPGRAFPAPPAVGGRRGAGHQATGVGGFRVPSEHSGRFSSGLWPQPPPCPPAPRPPPLCPLAPRPCQPPDLGAGRLPETELPSRGPAAQVPVPARPCSPPASPSEGHCAAGQVLIAFGVWGVPACAGSQGGVRTGEPWMGRCPH